LHLELASRIELHRSETQHLFYNSMYYVYCIQDLIKKDFYYGYTGDLVRRMKEHRTENKNWSLIYYEAYQSESDARRREQKLKDYGQSRTHLRKRIIDSIIK